MKGKEYWKHIAKNDWDPERIDSWKIKGTDRELISWRAIEKGVAFIALKEDRKARVALNLANALMFKKDDFENDYKFYLYKFLTCSLLQVPLNYEKDLLAKSKLKEIQKEIVKFEIRDVVDYFERCCLFLPRGIRISNSDYSTEGFKKTSPDKYYYQVLGIHLFETAKLLWLAKYNLSTDSFLKESLANLESALEKIPDTLAMENPRWEEFKSFSVKEVEEIFPEQTKYLREREDMKDNIPLYQRQVNILTKINDSTRKGEKLKWEKKVQLKELIHIIFRGKEGVSSNLTLADELLWIIILRLYLGTRDKYRREIDFYDFIREFLL